MIGAWHVWHASIASTASVVSAAWASVARSASEACVANRYLSRQPVAYNGGLKWWLQRSCLEVVVRRESAYGGRGRGMPRAVKGEIRRRVAAGESRLVVAESLGVMTGDGVSVVAGCWAGAVSLG